MTPELTALTLAALLQLLQLLAFVIAGNRQISPKVAMGNRDDKPELTGIPARLQRAYNNHFESLVLFTIAVTIITLSGQSTPLTQCSAWVYLAARVLYIPAYVFGLTPWRSIIWAVAIGAATLMLLSTVL